MIKKKGMESKKLQKERDMKDNLKMTEDMDLGNLDSRLDKFMKENGSMDSEMGKESFDERMENWSVKDFGKTTSMWEKVKKNVKRGKMKKNRTKRDISSKWFNLSWYSWWNKTAQLLSKNPAYHLNRSQATRAIIKARELELAPTSSLFVYVRIAWTNYCLEILSFPLAKNWSQH